MPWQFSTAAAQTSQEAIQAIKTFRTVPGFKIEAFATEPLIANPVSFAFDERGRAYVVETHRRRTSVYDIRRHPNWLDRDLSFRTVEDRANFFREVLVPENKDLPESIQIDRNGDGQFDFRDLEVESERIRLLTDSDGDGVADRAVTFADGFNTLVSGVAAGVLVRRGQVWFTCIPDLWRLQDTDQDGRADQRRALVSGFGVHIAFGGHDMHGLKFGPDGKLYFSIADRGLHVRHGGKTAAFPDTGAVLRCNPDGTDFEVFAFGLRNPQELAFDQYGNLWTGDNNGDGGDKARWVYLLEGSDSGWHMGWQYLPKMGSWNSEKLWELHGTNTAAYILPPVAHIGHGPAGIVFNPGTGLPARYDHHFFMCDFPGGVRSFALKPKGSAYEVTGLHEFFWGLYPVDVDFGVDGGIYVADWIQGWEKTGKGRIYRVYHSETARDSTVRETKELLAEDFREKSRRQLSRLLGHVDQRVRLEAQYALAESGSSAIDHLFQVARKDEFQLARLHAIWGLGQIGRTDPLALSNLLTLVEDPDPEVRAQVARVLGDNRFVPALDFLAVALRDPNPRVRLFAAFGLGKLGLPEATEPIFQMLRLNAGQDPYLRHAGVMALVWLNDINALISAAKDNDASVRLASLLAMRRLARPEAAMFLYDPEPALVLEAARAIYDLPIESGFVQLANLSTQFQLPEAVLQRAVHAHYRLGNLENALVLAEIASHHEAPEALRVVALQRLAEWANPPGRDSFLGLWRPLPTRDNRAASLAVRSELSDLLESAPGAVRAAAIQCAVRLEIGSLGGQLMKLLQDGQLPEEVRLEALKALDQTKDSRLKEAIAIAITDASEALRKEASQMQAKLNPEDTLTQIVAAMEKGTMGEKQVALGLVGDMKEAIADRILLGWIENLQAGQVPNELKLDLLEAVEKRSAPDLKAKLELYLSGQPKDDPLSGYRSVLFGGDPQAGRKIFFERADLGCLRCHQAEGEGGLVGPNLTGIASEKSREQLLESILYPNQEIAPGYENVSVVMEEGGSYAGQVKSETDQNLVLVSEEFGLIVLGKDKIKSRARGLSSMPEELANFLTKRELRDLIEYLASLRTPAAEKAAQP